MCYVEAEGLDFVEPADITGIYILLSLFIEKRNEMSSSSNLPPTQLPIPSVIARPSPLTRAFLPDIRKLQTPFSGGVPWVTLRFLSLSSYLSVWRRVFTARPSDFDAVHLTGTPDLGRPDLLSSRPESEAAGGQPFSAAFKYSSTFSR